MSTSRSYFTFPCVRQVIQPATATTKRMSACVAASPLGDASHTQKSGVIGQVATWCCGWVSLPDLLGCRVQHSRGLALDREAK